MTRTGLQDSDPGETSGLVLDPRRFDPAAAARVANEVIRAGGGAQALLQEWVAQAQGLQQAMAAVIAARLALTPVPPLAGADTIRPDAPPLPHHPFMIAAGLPFLPVGEFEAGGASLAPGDAIDALFRGGRLREAMFDPAADPFQAVTELLQSERWRATIQHDAEALASMRVRWQAARASEQARLPAAIDPTSADPSEFDAWWQDCLTRASSQRPRN